METKYPCHVHVRWGAQPVLGGTEVEHAQGGRVALCLVFAQGRG